VGEVELPGQAESVGDPAELGAEAVLTQRHQGLAAFGKGGVAAIEFVLGVALDEQRDGRGERELVPAAVDAHEFLAGQGEGGVLHGALGSGLAGTVAGQGHDLGVLEQRGVERHGLLGPALEHQEGRDLLRCHGGSPQD
jgi:hypothetical protein